MNAVVHVSEHGCALMISELMKLMVNIDMGYYLAHIRHSFVEVI